jgi:alkenylglycerophosphocholine/alkenylglycerophosphoethanolamine hydrolase
VAVYIAVICLMLGAAWATLLRPDWSPLRRVLAIGGASLFAASDAMLAWERFVSSSRSGPLRVMLSYNLAQMALAASIALL